MIEKLSIPLVGTLSNHGISRTPSLDHQRSPFRDILQQELSPSKTLDKIILDYLIKTMQSFLLTQNPEEPFSPFLSLPFCSTGHSNPQPEIEKTTPETALPLSVGKIRGQKFDEIIRTAAGQYGVDPALVKAVIEVESRGNPEAVSPAGAQGLMQLMPKTAADLGVTDSFDPAQNIKAGTRYLSQLLDRYEGNLQLALAAYNWGMGNLEKNPQALPKETRNYIVRVERRYQTYLNSSSAA